MKKLQGELAKAKRRCPGVLILFGVVLATAVLTGCDLFGERRYGEGDVVRVLINLSHTPETQHFVNLQIFNDSDQPRLLRIAGFEYLDGDEWQWIPPSSEHEWMTDFMSGGDTLTPAGTDRSSFGTVMNFHDWLNPDYPTIGEFRAVIRVYDLDGNYQFTQASNVRELQYFSF